MLHLVFTQLLFRGTKLSHVFLQKADVGLCLSFSSSKNTFSRTQFFVVVVKIFLISFQIHLKSTEGQIYVLLVNKDQDTEEPVVVQVSLFVAPLNIIYS